MSSWRLKAGHEYLCKVCDRRISVSCPKDHPCPDCGYFLIYRNRFVGCECPFYKNRKLIILAGLPGSGKSTLAAKLQSSGYYRLNADSVRGMLFWDSGVQRNGDLVFGILGDALIRLCREGVPIVWDNTSLEYKDRYQVAYEAALNCYSSMTYLLDTPLEECKRRNLLRPSPVPESVIDSMAQKLQITDDMIRIRPR